MTRKAGRPCLKPRLRLIVVTDMSMAAPHSLIDVVRLAVTAGAPCVQLRNKGQAARELLEIGRDIRAITREAGALLFVNDRLDVALALEADGVHLGPTDLPVAAARAAAPPGFLIGRSADEVRVAQGAVSDGADYIGCGTVYATRTKGDAGAAIGLPRLAAVVQSVAVPVVAIGGITPANVGEVAETGATGVAVVSAVIAAADPAREVRALLRPWEVREAYEGG